MQASAVTHRIHQGSTPKEKRERELVDALANLALETLRDLLVEEAELLLSVSDEVEQVKTNLRSIHAMLMKADRERSDSPTLKLYVTQLEQLAFKAETVLETYAVKVASKKEARSLKQKLKRYICLLCECSDIHEVGRDIRNITSRLADLTGKFESEFGQPSSGHQQEDLTRLTLAHEVVPHFVGMEKEIEELVSMMKDEGRSERVIKIYGMGGLGKTTLARKIYNHDDMASFARAWVCVTQQFQAKAVFGKILKKLDDNVQIDNMDVSELAEEIHGRLEQSKGLLVIDDIWENEHWEIIKKCIPMNCNVLLTTRNQSIADPDCHPYKLELLTEDQGWDLLKNISLASSDETSFKSLVDIGRDIVKKCGCLPLSISVIGGVLRQKEHTLAEWEKVNRSIGSYLRHGEGVEEYKRVKQVLELSYDALPYYLKPCFLYLACFPEDVEIETERLYLLWMAEGFIAHQDKGHDESLMEVAERYLSELAMRCMVQVNKSQFCSSFKKFDVYQLHDLMHDLCSSKAADEILLKRLQFSSYLDDTSSPINRLAIITNKEGVKGLEKVKDLRSFMILVVEELERIPFEDVKINVEGSLCLRILLMVNCKFEDEKLPDKVGKLIHLRYLSMRYSFVRELPKFVCGMPYLQTLDLRVSSSQSFRLPNEFWRMKRLKHLFLPHEIEVIKEEKLRLDGLDELETLEGIDSTTARVADIPKLTRLRKVAVSVGDMDSMSAVLQSMSNNNKSSRYCELNLSIESCDLSRDVLNSVLMCPSLSVLILKGCNVSGGFPSYKEGMCQKLNAFMIASCKVRGEDMNIMEVLGNYPILQNLMFIEVEFSNTETFICPSNSFPLLDMLMLRHLSNIKKWEVEEGAMPKLTNLHIAKCINLEKLPDGLRFISTLRHVDILLMPKEFNERVRGEDSDIVSHIPRINISDD